MNEQLREEAIISKAGGMYFLDFFIFIHSFFKYIRPVSLRL